MDFTRTEMVDELIRRRKEQFDDELEKYRITIENLSDDKLTKVYKSIIKKE